MFGYVMVDGKTLTKDENDRYQELYCGLCKKLYDKYRFTGRMTLTYDMTFLSSLLSSLYSEEETGGIQRCPVHPIRAHRYSFSPATDYAADLSVVLAYYKCLDDWKDEHNIIAREKSKLLQKQKDIAAAKWPRQCAAIENGLAELSLIERQNELIPDIPANCFGVMLGELFIRESDEHTATLRKLGAALGRFVYMLDAVNDLRDDIKKERYNPLIATMDTDFTAMLTALISECTKEFNALPLSKDVRIIRNTLYSGVWMKYKLKGRAE